MNLSSQLGPIFARFSRSKKNLSFTKNTSFGTRNNTLVYNSFSFPNSLIKGLLVLSDVLIKGGKVLVVDTNSLYSIKDLNPSPQLSISTKIWISGTITNLQQANLSGKSFSLISQLLETWFKRHQIVLPRYKKSKDWFSGIKQDLLNSSPTLIVIINLDENLSLVKEAFKLKIPIIALVESNLGYKKIEYPILINTKCPKTRLLIWWKIWNLALLLARERAGFKG